VSLDLRPLTRLAHRRDVIRNFTPNWFTVNMGTGILALMLGQFPHHVPGLSAVSRDLWLANIALFSLFTALFTARALRFPRESLATLRHPIQSMFVGAIPMGLATIVNGFVAFGQPLLGERAIAVAHALWWVDAALAVLSGWLVPYLMFTDQRHGMDQMTAVWLLPIVPAEVAAASGGILAPHLPAAAAQVVIATSGVLWAFSVPLALAVLSVLFLRLALHRLPPGDLGVTGWLTLGPLGTGAQAMVLLGAASVRAFAGTPLAPAAQVAQSIGLVVGLVLWGYGAWWWVIAILTTLHHVKRTLPFNMGWWAFTFPLGVFTAATLAIAHATGAAFFTLAGGAFVMLLAGLWSVVAARTAHGAWHGYLFRDAAPARPAGGRPPLDATVLALVGADA